MRKWLIGFAFLGLSCWSAVSFAAGTHSNWREEPTGFRGLNWETPVASVKGLIHDHVDPSYGGLDVYRRAGDDLQIGGARLSKIEYAFWRGRLYSVTIHASGSVDCSSLKDAIAAEFGAGGQAIQYIESYVWWGPVSSALYNYNNIGRECLFHLSSSSMNKEAETADSARAQEGARKGF